MYRSNVKVLGVVAVTMLWLGTAGAAEYTVDQHNKTFEKDGAKIEKISVKVGDTIHFRNMDPWFHNVFSLSDLKTFDLGSYPQGQQKPVVFDKAGTVQVECAIHPQMQLEVEVQ
jgi:plastocyanin